MWLKKKTTKQNSKPTCWNIFCVCGMLAWALCLTPLSCSVVSSARLCGIHACRKPSVCNAEGTMCLHLVHTQHSCACPPRAAVDSETQDPERFSVCFPRHSSYCLARGGAGGAPFSVSHPGKIDCVLAREQPAGGNGSGGGRARLSFKWRTIDSVGGCCYRGAQAAPPERASARVRVWKGAGHSEAIHNLLSAAGLGEARSQGLSLRVFTTPCWETGRGGGRERKLASDPGDRGDAPGAVEKQMGTFPGAAPPLASPPFTVLVEK